jgi:hypothetical protein
MVPSFLASRIPGEGRQRLVVYLLANQRRVKKILIVVEEERNSCGSLVFVVKWWCLTGVQSQKQQPHTSTFRCLLVSQKRSAVDGGTPEIFRRKGPKGTHESMENGEEREQST